MYLSSLYIFFALSASLDPDLDLEMCYIEIISQWPKSYLSSSTFCVK